MIDSSTKNASGLELSDSKSLITRIEDKYFIPGYKGYCPQYKYRYGRTFGKETHELLNSRNSADSSTPSLFNSTVSSSSLVDGIITSSSDSAVPRTTFLSDSKIYRNADIKSGYCGFIPHYQNYFGKTYSSNCKLALNSFAISIDERKFKDSKLGSTRKIIEPRSRLYNFVDPESKRISETNTKQWSLRKTRGKIVYEPSQGMKPNYTGHIPGIKYTQGTTFTESSRNALNESLNNLKI